MNRIRLFFFVIFVQIFILNNIQLNGYINPYYYIIFLLTIPLKENKSFILLKSFLLGCIIDVFSNTYGLHAFACVLTGYIKVLIDNSKESEELLTITQLTMERFIFLSSILIFIHHFTLFFLEVFSFQFESIVSTFTTTITSGIFTLILLIIHRVFITQKV